MNYLQKPQPKLKQHVMNRTREINLPIPLGKDSLSWKHVSGIFIGTAVMVENVEEADILSMQGCFGKKPWPSSTNGKYPILRARQWKRRKDWKWKEINTSTNHSSKTNNGLNSLPESSEGELSGAKTQDSRDNVTEKIKFLKQKHKTIQEEENGLVNKVIVINDSDDEGLDSKTYLSKLNPTICREPFSVRDTLYLTLEEAFFLSFALYCLTVSHMFTKKVLSLNELWRLCKNADSTFVEKYVTYHYFRIKGWIVKSGLNFGCDYALYKRGPAFYHASCLVKIRNVNHPNKTTLSWENIMGYCRVSEAAKKDFVLCEVTWPKRITGNNNCDINDLSEFSVTHKLLQRWTASENRVQKNL